MPLCRAGKDLCVPHARGDEPDSDIWDRAVESPKRRVPHARGDEPQACDRPNDAGGDHSVPHARGDEPYRAKFRIRWTPVGMIEFLAQQKCVFPTPVGMNRSGTNGYPGDERLDFGAVFPTPVGMNRCVFCRGHCVVPHARGDEPEGPADRRKEPSCVPHARGDEPAPWPALSSRSVFPTPVGMNRADTNHAAGTGVGVPHARGDEPQ